MSTGPSIRRAIPSDANQMSELTQRIQAAHAAAMPDVFKPAHAGTFAAHVIRELLSQPEAVLLVKDQISYSLESQ